MNGTRNDAGQGISIGVLIIGSLYWDSSDHRKKWRDERHALDAEKYVRAPIRYGRKSGTRGNTCTMVLSMDLVREKQFGRAIVVPYRQPVRNPDGLVEEAERLWAAERNIGSRCCLSAAWGCVALLANPERPLSDEIRTGWTARVSQERHYGPLRTAAGEEAVVDKSGFLNIPWPSSDDGSDLGVDALLATATNPTIVVGHYPSSQQVAEAWNTRDGRNHIDYFCRNRAHGLRTSQDDAIADRLRELWR